MELWKQHDNYSWQSGEYWIALNYVSARARFTCWYVPLNGYGQKCPIEERTIIDVVDSHVDAKLICKNHYEKRNPQRQVVAETELEKMRRIVHGQ